MSSALAAEMSLPGAIPPDRAGAAAPAPIAVIAKGRSQGGRDDGSERGTCQARPKAAAWPGVVVGAVAGVAVGRYRGVASPLLSSKIFLYRWMID